MSEDCSLCGSRYCSSALNQKEKNKKRPIETRSKEIYKIIKQLKGGIDTGHTCTYCRDVLRSLNKKYEASGNKLSSEIEENVRNGSLFPRRNLKRQGGVMGLPKKNQAKPSRTSSSTASTCVEVHKETSSGLVNINVEMEDVSNLPTQNTEGYYVGDGLVAVDEGLIEETKRQLISSQLKRSQDQSTSDKKSENHAKRIKISASGKSTQESSDGKDELPVSQNEVSTKNYLYRRLCEIHSKHHQSATRSHPFIIQEMMRLWKISKFPVIFDFASFKDPIEMSAAINVLLEFLITGKGVSLDNMGKIVSLLNESIVNDFVLGLLTIESFKQSPSISADFMTELLPKINPSVLFGKVFIQIISLKKEKQSHQHFVMTVYNLVRDNLVGGENGYIFDGESEGNYGPDMKQYFYYWLYHQVAMCPRLSPPEILFSHIKPEPNALYPKKVVLLHFKDKSSGEIQGTSIHPLVLMLLQNSDPVTAKSCRIKVTSAFRKLCISKSDLDILLKVLYQPKPVTNFSKSAIVQVPALDAVDVFLALGVENPTSLLFKDFDLTTPYTLKLAVGFYERTLDPKYISNLFREPFRYLSLDNVSLLQPTDVKLLVMLDEVAFNEKELYRFILEFSKQFCETDPEDSSKMEKTRNLLLSFVRYPLMTKEEFKDVDADGVLTREETLTFWLHLTSDFKPGISDKFWKPTVPRRTYEEK